VLRPKRGGRLSLRAHKTGYIRAAARTVKVRSSAARAAASPLTYLLGAQNRDGGFGAGRGRPSSALYSGWVALALVADGRDPAHIARHGHSLLAYIEATLAHDPGSLERTILVAGATGVPATDFDGHNLVAALQRHVRPNGSVSGQVNLTSFAVLAFRAAGVTPPKRMLRWLVRQQDANGGFSFAKAGDLADVDDTAAALEALARQSPCGGFHSRRPEPGRWLPGRAGRSLQRPVHGVGGAGSDRRRCRPGARAHPPLAVAAWLPTVADHPQRCDRLRPWLVADAGMGHGRGDRRTRPKAISPAPADKEVSGWTELRVSVPGPSRRG
jgi:hypothetical protein